MKTAGKVILAFIVLAGVAGGAALYFTSGLVEVSEKFFSRIAEGKPLEAYELTSVGFQEATSPEDFLRFIGSSGLNNFGSADWYNRSIENDQGTLEGTVRTRLGASIPIRLDFVRESGQWKVLFIGKPRTGVESFQEEKIPESGPRQAEQIRLVKEAMLVFGEAVNESSMESFHEYISELWQEQFTVEMLDETFGSLYGRGIDLTSLKNFLPIFSLPGAMDKDGVFNVEGYFPTTPERVHFSQKYIYEKGSWKLLGFSLHFEKAASDGQAVGAVR